MSVDPVPWKSWAANLGGNDPDQQIESLRQISLQDRVTGFAKRVVQLAASPHEEVRQWAAEAMETTIQPVPEDADAFIQLLDTGPDEVGYWAATMLGRLGTAAAQASDALVACAGGSGFVATRERAVWALCQIGPLSPSAIATLTRLAQNAPPRLQRLAAHAIESAPTQPADDSAGVAAA